MIWYLFLRLLVILAVFGLITLGYYLACFIAWAARGFQCRRSAISQTGPRRVLSVKETTGRCSNVDCNFEEMERRILEHHKQDKWKDSCSCGNPEMGFDCVCAWVGDHPGNIEFTCKYCGIYSAGESRCNCCETG